MNVFKFNRKWKDSIVYCMLDNTKGLPNEIGFYVKNQADFVLDNVFTKGYEVLLWTDEDVLLREAAKTGKKFALVFSTGTEFLNGDSFFTEIEKLITRDFFIAGHILDRKDAYYELHQQCYLINLDYYRQLEYPKIGKQIFGETHIQSIPKRSKENYHDDYTPLWITSGLEKRTYNHKCHGWNIISMALDNDLPILTFNDDIRKNKLYLYPESTKDFYKQLSWQYNRLDFCKNIFVHQKNTETIELFEIYEQIVTPASGDWFKKYIDNNGKIIYYDYNLKSLEYWKNNCPTFKNVEFYFSHCDLLGDNDFLDHVDPDKKTLVNLSNIFNYEGTAFFYSKDYRDYRQKNLEEKIKNKIKNVKIICSMPAKIFEDLPTWHL